MIYRAIIEEVIDSYTAKVRIPLIHRTSNSNQFTASENLPEAKVATLSNCQPNIHLGDIVIVSFENNDSSKPIIIGYLYTREQNEALMSCKFSTLEVTEAVTLTEDTSIGDVTPFNLKQLVGVNKNLQEQINELTNRIDILEVELKNK